MQLPPDNSFILDELDRTVLDPTNQPAKTPDDVAELLPDWTKNIDSPIKSALVSMLAAVANFLWARFGQAVAQQATPLFAEGQWLDYWGRLLHRPRVANESDGDYRARLLSVPDRVSPKAIMDAVLATAAQYTTVIPAFEEPMIDGAYASPANNPAWSAYAQPKNGRLWARYPGSLCKTPGAYVTPAARRAEFWVILPGGAAFGLKGETQAAAFAMPSGSPYRDFVNPTSVPDTWAGAARYTLPAKQSLAQAVISDVEFRKAGGVRWALIIDPNLPKAL